EARDESEVFCDLSSGGKLVAVRVGRKRPVRHAFDEKALPSGRVHGPQELSVRDDSGCRRRRWIQPNIRRRQNGSAHSVKGASCPAAINSYCIKRLPGGAG